MPTTSGLERLRSALHQDDEAGSPIRHLSQRPAAGLATCADRSFGVRTYSGQWQAAGVQACGHRQGRAPYQGATVAIPPRVHPSWPRGRSIRSRRPTVPVSSVTFYSSTPPSQAMPWSRAWDGLAWCGEVLLARRMGSLKVVCPLFGHTAGPGRSRGMRMVSASCSTSSPNRAP